MSKCKCVGVMLGLLISHSVGAQQAPAAEDPILNRAYNDHIAYVLTFMLPVMSERCLSVSSDYVRTVGPLFLRFMADNQQRIERGRLLTMSEFEPQQTLASYRQGIIDHRSKHFDSLPSKGKAMTCAAIAAVLGGQQVPGEWPSRK